VAVVFALVQTKQIRINIHKRNNTQKHSTNSTKHSKYKYTYYQNTHTLKNPHISKQVKSNHRTRYRYLIEVKADPGHCYGRQCLPANVRAFDKYCTLFVLKYSLLKFMSKFLVTIILYRCLWPIYQIYRKAGSVIR